MSKRKIVVIRDKNNLTEEEMRQLLSDEDLDDSDKDKDFQSPENSEDESSDSYDSTDYKKPKLKVTKRSSVVLSPEKQLVAGVQNQPSTSRDATVNRIQPSTTQGRHDKTISAAASPGSNDNMPTSIEENLIEDEDSESESDTSDSWFLPRGNQPQFGEFREYVGVSPAVIEELALGKPEDFYMAVVDESIFEVIADETNLYATQKVENTANVSAQSRLHEWVPTNVAEIKRLLGLIAYMGLVKMPYIKDYWSRDIIFKNEFAQKVMSRNRFELLLRMLHFANNDTCQDGDRLHRIQGLIDKLVENFQALYHPAETVCVDESLIPFRGRLIMRQYLKQKRHKYGIKLFKLCTGHGYTYRLKVYAGKNLEVTRTTPKGVVMELCEPVLNVGRTICTDNWYTSIDLANALLARKTHLVGTLRKNRKNLPRDITHKVKMKRGQVVAKENSRGITVLNWKDKRNVIMLSTKHSNETVEIAKKNGENITKPKVIVDYNIAKSSVDLSDQMAAYSSPLRKTIKWYRKLAVELLLSTSMVNAHILYKECTGKNIGVVDFRKEVIRYLTSASKKMKMRRVQQNAGQEEYDIHWSDKKEGRSMLENTAKVVTKKQ